MTERLDHGKEDEHRGRAAEEDPVAELAHEERDGGAGHDGGDEAPGELAGERLRIGVLPAGERTHAHQEHARQHERTEDGVKVRGADRDLACVERVEEERIERAEKHGTHGHDEQHVVDEEHRLAGDEREVAAQTHRRGAPCKEQEREADDDDEEGQNEETALGVGREGVHRGEHAGAHEEGAEERERERQDREEHRPDAEATALFGDGERVDERGAREPRHERGVLDRVPEPPAAPAELVVGPVGAERDAEREEHPGGRRPRTHPAGPGGVKTTGDERGDREGERHGEAHVAQIEERRMEDHARVLQQRIEVRALGGRREEAQERVGGEQHEEEEAHADEAEHARHAGDHLGGQAAGAEGDRGAPPSERHRPEEDRAFVRAPGRGHLVVPGQKRVGVVRHVEDGEVRQVERVGKAANGHRAEERVGGSGGTGDRHQRAVALGSADKREHALDDAQRKAQDQCEVTDFRNHLISPVCVWGRMLPSSLFMQARAWPLCLALGSGGRSHPAQ